MPDTTAEERRAALAKMRGEQASKITDPQKRREYIARQGELETRGKGTTALEKETMMDVALGGPPNYVSRDALHVSPGAASGVSHAGERVPYKVRPDLAGATGQETAPVTGTSQGVPGTGPGSFTAGEGTVDVPAVTRELNPVERARQRNNRVRDQRTSLGRGKTSIVETEE